MQKYQRTTIFLLLFLCVPSIWASSSLNGDWIGGFERPESRVFVHAHFQVAKDGTTGTIDVIDMPMDMRLVGKPLDKLKLNLSRVHFELADKASQFSFEGQATNGVMTGVVEDGGKKLPFRLDSMAKIELSRYVGTYQFGPGHFIRISAFNVFALFYLICSQGK